MEYRKRLLYLIGVASIVRIVIAATLELGNDEVYYYTYALHLQSNYFDHPPGVAWLIKLFTFNLHFQSELFLRLGSIVCAAIGTVISFSIGKKIRNERTGWIAALLYNTSIYASVISGLFILPDSPQIVFWLASLWLALLLIQSNNSVGKQFLYWLLFGVMTGLCIMCKVHGGFLWIGLGLYALFYQRRLLMQPGLYIAAIFTAAIISPIYFWNVANNFITWRFHSERVEVHSFSLDVDGFIQTISGQLFYNNPFNVVFILIAVFVYRKRLFLQKPAYRLLSFCGWPIIIFTTVISLFRSVLPHWSGPGFVSLTFIAAAFIDERLQTKAKTAIKVYVKGAVVLILFVLIAGLVFINFFPGTTGSKEAASYGDGDFTLDMYGWKSFGKQFNQWETQAIDSGQINPSIKLVCDKWFPAAHLDYYVARPMNKYVAGVGKLTDLHQYAWLNTWRGGLEKNEDALCVIPGNNAEDPKLSYGKYFREVVFMRRFTVLRGGKAARTFDVFVLRGFLGNDELHGQKFN